MLTHLNHPVTGEKTSIESVLSGCFDDYFPRAYIAACVDEPKWTGEPSVRQCVNGARMEYLKIVCDYSIDPEDHIFMLIGTSSISMLDNYIEKEYAKIEIEGEHVIGTIAALEKKQDETFTMIDYKNYGSYKAQLMLASTVIKRDDNKYYTVPNWKLGENKLVELELNELRILVEKQKNIKITEIKLMLIIRDGNTKNASDNGIIQSYFYLPIPILEDKKVENYFRKKSKLIIDAVNDYHKSIYSMQKKYAVMNNAPSKCNSDEAWNGRRCNKKYCPVSNYCKFIEANKGE